MANGRFSFKFKVRKRFRDNILADSSHVLHIFIKYIYVHNLCLYIIFIVCMSYILTVYKYYIFFSVSL